MGWLEIISRVKIELTERQCKYTDKKSLVINGVAVVMYQRVLNALWLCGVEILSLNFVILNGQTTEVDCCKDALPNRTLNLSY